MAPAGWNTREQIRDHKLATSIINGHGTDNDAVFDETELDRLRRFVMSPAQATRNDILSDNGLNDTKSAQTAADNAAAEGSLVGYLVGRHGTDDPAFDQRDLDMLREWFEKGAPTGEKVVR